MCYRVQSGDTRIPVVAVIMGSKSDFEPCMSAAAATLEELHVLHEVRVVSAHRTPDRLHEYAKMAASRGIKVIIAGAGGAAHLPGMAACIADIPVIGVPVQSKALKGLDSLLSIVQMPSEVPVGTMSIGRSGAINAAIYAAKILALSDPELHKRLVARKQRVTSEVPEYIED